MTKANWVIVTAVVMLLPIALASATKPSRRVGGRAAAARTAATSAVRIPGSYPSSSVS